jgi:hypothetical protein
LGSVSSEDRGEHVAETFLEFRATGRVVHFDAVAFAGCPIEPAPAPRSAADPKQSFRFIGSGSQVSADQTLGASSEQ